MNIMRQSRWLFVGPLLLVACNIATTYAADWSTYRGNVARTGNIDGKAGPAKPKLIWSRVAKENFVGSPCIADDLLCFSSLGGFNSGAVTAIEISNDAQRVAWAKTPPLLKLPIVASPIFADDAFLIGDGMHQTDGAMLRAFSKSSGRLLWQHAMPGKLVHMESAATAANDRIYIGAGNGGILCVDPAKLTFRGQEQSAAAIQEELGAEWKKLTAAYEKEKLSDPDFAIPPSEDSLAKAEPRVLWQVGSNKWHVDAPLAVVQNKVLAASAYLELEKSGDRALLCLDAATGDTLWKTPLDFNPWAGASVSGDTVILGCSNIRLDPKEVRKGRGALVALSLADGKVLWKKPLAGGIVSSVALTDSLAIATGVDGKIRAHDITTGDVKWTYTGGAPFFGGPAIADSSVYAGDLQGVLHAVNVNDGREIWKFDLNGSGATKHGMVFGGPVIHGGRLFVGTCNLDSPASAQQAVVCLGD